MPAAPYLGNVAVVEGAGDEEDDVVNHVAVGDVVEEGGEGLDGLLAHVVELCHELVLEALVNGGDGQGAGLVGQKVAVVRRREVQLQVCRARSGGGVG